ncbi:hypothetical protein ACJRO7_027124 [Eucalyptus globulus]|uniref:Late embryogenesis abundant protein LEA-2 subgroup domain-containing protein n=1 Tax=Eucalyptus globulus TaxID=34317 RepID=A0ABD3JST5_EUCGL
MEVQRQQRYDPESNRGAGKTVDRVMACVNLVPIGGAIAVVLFILLSEALGHPLQKVRVASLSLSLPSTPSPPPSSTISGNWSVALSVKNHMPLWRRLSWDHAQVMLFYRGEFVAGTFLQGFCLPSGGKTTVETGAAAFSREVKDRVAQAIAKDSEDGGVMELELRLLNSDGDWRDWSDWDSFVCHGLKVGFSSQNQSQVGSLLSCSTHKCA